MEPPASTAERTVSVPPERLGRWIAGFAERHGAASVSVEPDRRSVVLTGGDGGLASISVPFPPLPAADGDPIAALVAHVALERRVGALLVRKGGFAVGVFAGRRLVASKVGSSYVQGRTKAGGWSQQRFSRRRDNQATKAYEKAADAAAAVLLPAVDTLDALGLGGDRAGLSSVLADRRLTGVAALAPDRILPVAEPRLVVLEHFPDQFLAVSIRLYDQLPQLGTR